MCRGLESRTDVTESTLHLSPSMTLNHGLSPKSRQGFLCCQPLPSDMTRNGRRGLHPAMGPCLERDLLSSLQWLPVALRTKAELFTMAVTACLTPPHLVTLPLLLSALAVLALGLFKRRISPLPHGLCTCCFYWLKCCLCFPHLCALPILTHISDSRLNIISLGKPS